jgi:hypothetical protein
MARVVYNCCLPYGQGNEFSCPDCDLIWFRDQWGWYPLREKRRIELIREGVPTELLPEVVQPPKDLDGRIIDDSPETNDIPCRSVAEVRKAVEEMEDKMRMQSISEGRYISEGR